MTEIMSVKNVSVDYERNGKRIRAVSDVDLSLNQGEVLGLVGESGCGKSSLGKAIVGILTPSSGEILFDNSPVKPLTRRSRPINLRSLQMVFQDPYGSLNPRRKIGAQIADGLVIAGLKSTEARSRSAELLDKVGMSEGALDRYPHQFSGGQRQRIAIARALAAEPTVLIADEPISALDTSSQAQVANLLVDLVQQLKIGMIFISHDLSVVRQIADRTAVMYLGRIVEVGQTSTIWAQPAHPYTKALITAIPHADGKGILPADLPGDVPNPMYPPNGCRFHPRCPSALPICSETEPPSIEMQDTRLVSCHLQEAGEVVKPL
jgi:oligopeptide/dipeptide ABC transporter ATP-binding protein